MPFIGDLGSTQLVKGTGGFHPGVTPLDRTMVTWGTGKPLVTPTNNLQLYIAGGSPWSTYVNLPAYLIGAGKLTSTWINESDAISVTINYGCRVYMLRNPNWNSVDTTGWTLYESAKSYQSVDGNQSVYYKDFTPGTYTFDNNSAMYIFDFTIVGGVSGTGPSYVSNDAGSLHYSYVTGDASSTTLNAQRATYDPCGYNLVSYSVVSGSLPPGFSLNSSTGAITGNYSVQGINSDGATYTFTVRSTIGVNTSDRSYTINIGVPWRYRQIITTGYLCGGYKNSVLWSNTNRLTHSNDTAVNLGDGTIDNFHYKSGASGLNKVFIWNGTVTAFNMRTEVKSNSGSGIGAGNNGTAYNERLAAYVNGEGGGQVQRFTFSTETGANLGNGWTDQAASISGEYRGIWWGNSGQTSRMYFPTESYANMGYSAGVHGQQKGLMAKTGFGYGGNEGSYSGGYNFRRTNIESESQSNSYTKPGGWGYGEENFGMGQNKGYMMGQHDSSGQNNRSYTYTYATESGSQNGATQEPKGHDGASSGHMGWRD